MKRFIAALILLFIPASAFAITFPQFAIGGGYECLMLISNKTSFPWTGDIYIFSGNDQLWPSSWYVNGVNFTGERGVSLEIPRNASVKLRFTGDSQTRTGYLEIYGTGSSSSYGVSIAYFYQFILGDDIITSTGSPPAEPSYVFYVPVEKTSLIDTGLAWSPYSSTSNFPIRLTLYNSEGDPIGIFNDIYKGHESKLISEWFDIPNGVRGHLRIEAWEPIYLEALRIDGTDNGFLLTSTPPDGYTP